MAKNNKFKHLKLDYLLMLLVSLVLIAVSFCFRDELSHFSSLGLIGIFIVNIIGSATLFLPAPAIATVVAGGFLFNPLSVAVASALGSAIGDMVGFLLGHSGKEIFLKKNSFWYKFLKDAFHRFGALFIIIFSFIPNPLFDAVGIFAGVFSYSPIKFFFYVLIGRFLRNLLLAYLGSYF